MANWRVHPFTDADESVYIEAESATVPASTPFHVYLDEIPREDSPSSLRVREAATATEEITNGSALIYEGNPGTNYGTQTYLQTGRDGSGSFFKWRGLIDFDLTGLPAAVDTDEVLLTLYLNDTTGSFGFPGSQTISVNRVTSSWSEGSVTWTGQPSYDAVPEDTVTVTVAGFYTLDITDLYKDWQNGVHTNYGVIILSANESETGNIRQFASDNDGTSARRPKLYITETGGVYEEVARQISPAAEQFAVNYSRGILNFNSAQASTNIEIDYWGRGTPVRE